MHWRVGRLYVGIVVTQPLGLKRPSATVPSLLALELKELLFMLSPAIAFTLPVTIKEVDDKRKQADDMEQAPEQAQPPPLIHAEDQPSSSKLGSAVRAGL